jgi:hypothetical protein
MIYYKNGLGAQLRDLQSVIVNDEQAAIMVNGGDSAFAPVVSKPGIFYSPELRRASYSARRRRPNSANG